MSNNTTDSSLAIEATGICSWDWDFPSGRVQLSGGWDRILGYVPEKNELNIFAAEKLLHPEDQQRVMALLSAHLAGKTPLFECVCRARAKDGSWVWVLSRGNVVQRGADGKPLRLVGIYLDITRSRAVKEALQLQPLSLNQIRDRVTVTDLEGIITYSNDASCRMLQRTPEELIGQHVSILGEDPAVGASQEQVIHYTRTAGEWRGEVVNICKDGSAVILDLRTHLVRDPQGRPIGLCGIGTDITEQKRASERLRQSEAKFALAFQTSPYAFTISRAVDGVLLDVNEVFLSGTGYSREEVLGRSTRELNLWADPEERDRILADLAAGKPVVGKAARFRNKHGAVISGRFSAQTIKLENELCLLSSVEDLTEIKRAQEERARLEQQVHQAQKLDSIGRLAGGIAHDLNNLLSPILGYGELLLAETGQPESRREAVEEILKAGGRARDLVHQLLAFSRKQTLEFKAIELNALLKNFERLLRRTIREDIVISLALAEPLPPVRGDVGQLEQVLMNLAVNAQDAMPDGGKLTIATASVQLDQAGAAANGGVAPGRYVMLMVRDSGCGIPEEIRESLFEPFITTKDKDEGIGLGLATVYGIVKQHEGNISAESEPGQGAVFKVYLPAVQGAHQVSSPTAPPREDSRGSETILLVEDNRQVRKLALIILERQGYQVIAARSGKEALALAAQHQGPLHLLLTDVVMPEMNGKQLYQQAAGRYPGLKALYMSGYTDDVIARRGVINPGINFIQKPFSVQALAAKVREVLDG